MPDDRAVPEPGHSGDSKWVIESTAESFGRDCIERSDELPVVVDFWATWCPPCRMLGPMLESLAVEYNGRFLLAKVDTERWPELAASFQVQALPTVVALRGRRVVDQFAGLLAERELRDWLDSIQPSRAESLASQARRDEAVNAAEAETNYRAALALAPQDAAAQTGLARVLLAQGRRAESRQIIDELAQRGFLEPEAEVLDAELSIRAQAEAAGGIDACRRELAASPEDAGLRLRLAAALAGARQYEESLSLCLEVVQRDRKAHGDEARRVMVHIFQLLGPESELTGDLSPADFRRRFIERDVPLATANPQWNRPHEA